MLSAEVARTLIGYHIASNEQLWASIDTLSDEQFAAPVPYSHGSVRQHLIHMMSVDRRWLEGVQGRRVAHLSADDYPDRDTVRRQFADIAEHLRTYADSLTDDTLMQAPPSMPGPLWQVVAHLVNHGTDHRAQVLRLLHDYGAPTFDQDLIIHLW